MLVYLLLAVIAADIGTTIYTAKKCLGGDAFSAIIMNLIVYAVLFFIGSVMSPVFELKPEVGIYILYLGFGILSVRYNYELINLNTMESDDDR